MIRWEDTQEGHDYMEAKRRAIIKAHAHFLDLSLHYRAKSDEYMGRALSYLDELRMLDGDG